MISLLQEKRRAIEALCRKYHATKLEVFGSAAGENFSLEKSDVDFLVEFQPGADLGPWMGHYFEFRDELGELLGPKLSGFC